MIAKLTSLLSVCLLTVTLNGQSKSVLFIGNSYTGVNNLPQLTKDVALSVGDTLLYDAHTPGGAQLQQHASNATAIQKIFSQPWDHVILQAQSQEPSFSQSQVQQSVYPHAKILCDTIRANNSCTRPIFYRTWGRKNGDASNCAAAPWLCTYEGMDSALAFSYSKMANDNDAFLSPVGDVWKYIRANYPTIELYNIDESHPSLAGSYAAACTFYTIIFQKDPSLISFDASLNAIDAQNIRTSAKLIVYDSLLNWNVDKFKPMASFNWMSNGCTVYFDASGSQYASSHIWDFGDGTMDTGIVVSHTYMGGTFTPALMVSSCGRSDTSFQTISSCFTDINEFSNQKAPLIYPNPASNTLYFESQEYENFIQVEIIDYTGRMLKSIAPNPNLGVDISTLENGSYIARFTSKSGEIYLQTFLKQ